MAVKRQKGDADSVGSSAEVPTSAPDAPTLVPSQGSTEVAKTPKAPETNKGGGSGKGKSNDGGGGGGGGGGGKGDKGKGAKGSEPQSALTRLIKFIGEVVAEFRRITWPTRHQVMRETWSVLFLVTAITVMVLGFDWVLSNAFFTPIDHWARMHNGGIGRGY